MASTSHNPTSPPTKWDVFLSFRGEDTRYSFTAHLHSALCRAGIKTFMDNPELRSGEVISDSLIQAIQDSNTYIVVLSKNYASSPWCLGELEEILACYKRMKRLVIPVFYHIYPSVVRHQTSRFQEAFEKHQTRFDLDRVNKWRSTLNEVAAFSGFHVSKTRSEVDFIDEVVSRVLLEINPITLSVAEYPVGLDSRVKGITELFNNGEGVIRIGIHGMGGVGKTTLAKAVYNQNYSRFKGSSFLENVREVSRTKGLACLQQQLLNDVLKPNKKIEIDNVDQGIQLIREKICPRTVLVPTTVLVVIDDLDDPKSLKCLDGSFASGSMVIITTRNEDLLDRIKVRAKYKVDVMDEDESRQLFTQHAFGEDKISDTFTKLSKEILKRAGGLPLALKVFGSTLLNESEEGWRWFIDSLKQASIDSLKQASIDEVEKTLMISFHALKSVHPLQDIFLDIACFFIGTKKDRVLRIMETCYTYVTRNIDILKKRCLITFDESGNLKMHDLLRDMGRKIARNNCPDEPGKHSRLWVPEDINTVLKNNKVSGALEKLKTLNMTSSRNLTTTPDFTRLPCLETLDLSRCESLKEVHVSIGSLVSLVSLDLGHCENLRSLPDSICSLKTLEVLDISGCEKLEELPDQLGMITSLRDLRVMGLTMLKMIPDISQLSNIDHLDLSGCHHLLSIVQLPPNLKWVNAQRCRSLKKLPDLSSLKLLEKLDLTYCNVLTEIQGLEELTCLRELFLDWCHHLQSISELPLNLKSIWAKGCRSLKRLPNLSCLKQLGNLNIRNCSGLTEIKGWEELTSLKYLDLEGCNSSLLASTLTIRFFQILSGFGHATGISTEFPEWMSESGKPGVGVLTDPL